MPARMFFWAVVSDEINRVIEFFPTRWQAERMLAKVLWDEPAWQGILRVEKMEFRTGTANQKAANTREPRAAEPPIALPHLLRCLHPRFLAWSP